MAEFKLNAAQQQAVYHFKGPALVVAGAGTGKTQVVTQRLGRLIKHHHVKPSEILAITFTDKAAREMEARVSDLLGRYVLDVNITTFNAWGYETVRRFAYELGMNTRLELLSEAQELVFLRDHLDELKLKYYAPITNPEGLLGDLAAYFSRLQNELVTAERYQKFVIKLKQRARHRAERLEVDRHQELARAYRCYRELKRRANRIDFDDQVTLAVELLATKPNVARKLSQEIKFIMVDEFQDTNAAQSRLIDLLAGQHQNLMVVGDDDQSIYGFRGASISNILGFLERYPRAKPISLTANYRSSQAILDAAYTLIQHNNPDRLEAKYGISKQLRGVTGGQPPQLETAASYDAEAEWIAQDIKQQLKGGQSPEGIAILIRKRAQAAILSKYLEAEAVDYHLIGTADDLYRQPVVKTLIYLLRTLTDPADNTSFYHLLTRSPYQLDPRELRPVAAQADRQHHSLWHLLEGEETEAALPEALATIMASLQKLRAQLASLSVGQLCYQWLKETNYLHQLVQAARDDPALDQTLATLNQFFTSLREYETIAQDDSAVGYLQALPTLQEQGERLLLDDLPELAEQKVLILTVHKAKGLEFDQVYLFDLTQDTFPGRSLPGSLELPSELSQAVTVLNPSPQLLEERRLMYVAMTRAKQRLVLSWSADHGGRQAKRPSLFLEEALGSQPQLQRRQPGRINTAQIELFKPRRSSRSRTTDLPASLIRGDKLVLNQQQISDYLMCPSEFYLRYIISPPQVPSFALEYGNLLHGVIQQYNRQRLSGQPPPLKQMTDFLESNWPREPFISIGHRQRSLVQAKTTLKRFYQREQKSVRYPSYIEYTFEFLHPHAGVYLRGRLDAVYTAKPLEIRDYKTGAPGVTSQPKADQRAKDSLQLGIYALAWRTIRGELPPLLSLDFLDSGLVGQTSRTPRQLQTVEDKIEKVAEGIRAQDWTPARSHLFCTHPEYGL